MFDESCNDCVFVKDHVANKHEMDRIELRLFFYRMAFWPLAALLILACYTVHTLGVANKENEDASYQRGRHDALVELVADFKKIEDKWKKVDAEYNGTGSILPPPITLTEPSVGTLTNKTIYARGGAGGIGPGGTGGGGVVWYGSGGPETKTTIRATTNESGCDIRSMRTGDPDSWTTTAIPTLTTKGAK